MRDQLLAMNKNWVLGMSPYFAILLSRQARDLYSCIMNHFEFWNGDEDEFQMFVSDNYTSNIRLSLLRFKEYQTRIEEEQKS